MNTVAAQEQQIFKMQPKVNGFEQQRPRSHFSDCKELRLERDAPESVS